MTATKFVTLATIVAAVAFVAPARGSTGATLTAAERIRIDGIVSSELARDRTPGASIAIARDGVSLYGNGYGLRDVATKAAVGGDTIFEIGSVTKQFTAAAVMQLVQDGKVRLDAPIATYLADIPSGTTITVRQLLTHTSGLPNYTDAPKFFATIAKQPVTPRGIVAVIASKPLDFTPGTRWAYSNTNYAVLGLLIEKVSGESYSAYLQTHIFTPLALGHTRYSATYLERGDVALPYDVDAGTPRRVDATNLDWAYAAGALWSNATDLVRWQDALFSGRVLDANSIAAMTKPETLASGVSTDYGFGLFVTTMYGEREIWHTGGLPGYSAIDAYFPAQQLEIAVLGNAVTFQAQLVVRDILATFVPAVASRIAAETNATPAPNADPAMTKLATSLLAQVQSGNIDRSLFAPAANAALTPQLVAEVTRQLAPLGTPTSVVFVRSRIANGYRGYRYRIVWPSVALDETFALDVNGKIASWLFQPSQTASEAPPSSTPSESPATSTPLPSPTGASPTPR